MEAKASNLSQSVAMGAAAGLAVGLAANFVRKAAVQSPTVLASNWDAALAAEHAAALKIFDLIERTDNKATGRRAALLAQLKHAVGKHAFQEENVIYAMMRDHGFTEAADHLNHEHGYVKQYFFELTEIAKDDRAWLPKVKKFRTMIETHMREEESDLFPKLRRKLSDEQNKHVTAAMNKEGFKLA
ncbi:hemerythrin domain-containing protein [Sphingomonas sp. TZW2008]|uniref:hemerythrin domain-containing protein n=1 Tax=Sphingomonas sp. TZW2008 TaxID=1917973 RepID=UPI000A26823E|nr:hemerythrin domain-containing protein [Sphingomonas sp. TZW2008]